MKNLDLSRVLYFNKNKKSGRFQSRLFQFKAIVKPMDRSIFFNYNENYIWMLDFK